MEITRTSGDAPLSAALAMQIASTNATCIGCTGCKGLCDALLEALTVPDTILNRPKGPRFA